MFVLLENFRDFSLKAPSSSIDFWFLVAWKTVKVLFLVFIYFLSLYVYKNNSVSFYELFKTSASRNIGRIWRALAENFLYLSIATRIIYPLIRAGLHNILLGNAQILLTRPNSSNYIHKIGCILMFSVRVWREYKKCESQMWFQI